MFTVEEPDAVIGVTVTDAVRHISARVRVPFIFELFSVFPVSLLREQRVGYDVSPLLRAPRV